MKKYLLVVIFILISEVFCQTYYDQTLVSINNQERGRYDLAPVDSFKHIPLSDPNFWGDISQKPLILRKYHLYDFRNSPISNDYLFKIRDDFDFLRKIGKKCILSFAYTSKENDYDAPESVVRGHIYQLHPILRDNSELIVAFQAGFIGPWGEWHSSVFWQENDFAARQRLVDLLLDILPSPIPVLLRYVRHRRAFFGNTPVSESEAVSNTRNSRVGFHNDCFLSSTDDSGTYSSQNSNIDAERNYVAQNTKYVPQGGEVCHVNWDNFGGGFRVNCGGARKDLPMFHYTYLSFNYEKAWNTFGWEGCRQEMIDRLGYRLVLKSAQISPPLLLVGSQSHVMEFRFRIQNVGYAAPIYNRPMELVFVHPNGDEVAFLDLSRDNTHINLKKWLPENGEFEVSGRMNYQQITWHLFVLENQGKQINNMNGVYQLKLRFPDSNPRIKKRPEYCIGFANKGVYDAQKGWNNLNIAFTIYGGTGSTPAPCSKNWRYITITGNNAPLNIGEVEAYSNGVNVAFRKPASQSSTAQNFQASNAVDGNRDTYSHTAEGQSSPWLKIDLLSETKIDRVTIFNRREYKERLSRARVEFSNGCQKKSVTLPDMANLDSFTIDGVNTLDYEGNDDSLEYNDDQN